MIFSTGASERVRIDSSGNLFVATTTVASDDVGHALLANGSAYHTADGTYAGLFNRKSSNGEIVQIRKDNTVVGKIGIETSGLTVDGEANHSGIMFSASSFLPRKNYSGADGTVDLGTTDGRWKDLYLGGGAFIGGTGTANKLDDYEEGNWTPRITFNGNTAPSNIVYAASTQGVYTKVGRVVTINFHINLTNKGTGTNTPIWLSGSSLPFVSSGLYYASMYTPIFINSSGQTLRGYLYGTWDSANGVSIALTDGNTNITFLDHATIANNFGFAGTAVYYV